MKIDAQICFECHSKKLLSEFYAHPQMRNGHLGKCKDCSRLYGVWKNMHRRCYNKKAKDYKRYGGRGITIRIDWYISYPTFRRWAVYNNWMPGLQIDRIDNEGAYSPENCRIVTQRENARNTRTTKLTVQYVREIKALLLGKNPPKRKSIAQFYGVSPQTISDIKYGRSWADIN